MNLKRSFAVAAAVAAVLVLSGCGGPSDHDVTSALDAKVVARVAHVTGAVSGIGSDGTSSVTSLCLYLDDARPTVITSSVDKALEIAWRATPREPSEIYVSVVHGAKPAKATVSDCGDLDLTTTANSLGFEDIDVDLVTLVAYRDKLAARYGPWHKA